jgi:hypothetical protein
LAAAHDWTPYQVSRMDPVFIQEELARLRAEADVAREKREKRERTRDKAGESRATQGARKAKPSDAGETPPLRRRRGRRVVEDADVTEID